MRRWCTSEDIGPGYAWVAYEPIRKLFLASHISHQGNTIDAYLFIKELVSRKVRQEEGDTDG
jgi:hypothetical protein